MKAIFEQDENGFALGDLVIVVEGPSRGRVGTIAERREGIYRLTEPFQPSEPERNNMEALGELRDDDPMPFGKHKGKPMQDVPASYFHWLWTNGMEHDHKGNVADYIRRNLDALKMEYRNGIW